MKVLFYFKDFLYIKGSSTKAFIHSTTPSAIFSYLSHLSYPHQLSLKKKKRASLFTRKLVMAIEIEQPSVGLSKVAVSDTHGEDSPYFAGWKAYDENPYDELNNPSGVIQMGLAENQVSVHK